MILNQEREERLLCIRLQVEVTMDVHNPSFGPEEATAAIEKDGGDAMRMRHTRPLIY